MSSIQITEIKVSQLQGGEVIRQVQSATEVYSERAACGNYGKPSVIDASLVLVQDGRRVLLGPSARWLCKKVHECKQCCGSSWGTDKYCSDALACLIASDERSDA